MAGLTGGDVICSMERVPVQSVEGLIATIFTLPVEKAARMELMRGNGKLVVDVVLQKRPAAVAAVTRQTQHLRWRGVVMGMAASREASAVEGVRVLSVGKDCPLVGKGVVAGAVFSEVGGKPVRDLAELQWVINELTGERCSVRLASEKQTSARSRPRPDQ